MKYAPVIIIPAVYAIQPTEAGGEILGETAHIKDIRFVDGNTIITATTILDLAGNLSGVFVDNESAVIRSDGEGTMKGSGTFYGTVDGVPGTLLLSVASKLSNGGFSGEGNFVILSGTDGLSDMRGQGTFQLEGWSGTYSVQLHSHPG